MTQPQQPAEPTVGDLIIEDLERQLSESDPRYGRKCRELATLRAQYTQLMQFLQSKKDVLGLTEVDAAGEPLDGAVPEAPAESDVPADSEQKPINGAKRVSANTGT